MKYSIDTSAILDGWRRHYPRDVFPEIWRRSEALIRKGDLRATEEVKRELEKKNDDALAWARQQEALFVPIDDLVQDAVSEILVEHERLIDTRRGRSGADPFVIRLPRFEDARSCRANFRAETSGARRFPMSAVLWMSNRCVSST